MKNFSPTRHSWFWPALFAIILFIGSITANQAPLPDEFKQQYGSWLWVITILAGMVTVGLVIWENRKPRPPKWLPIPLSRPVRWMNSAAATSPVWCMTSATWA